MADQTLPASVRAMLKEFSLGDRGISLLASFAYHMTEADIGKEAEGLGRRREHEGVLQGSIVGDKLKKMQVGGHEHRLNRKQEWSHRWSRLVEQAFRADEGGDKKLIKDPDALISAAQIYRTEHDPFTCGLLLLELAAFSPYYPLSDERDAEKDVRGLAMDLDVRTEFLVEASKNLIFPARYGRDLAQDLQQRLDNLTDRRGRALRRGAGAAVLTILAAGLAAPLLAGFVGATLFALEGTAAVTAGLAALGGGAMAAGSLGMQSSGMVALVGGSSLIAGEASGSEGWGAVDAMPREQLVLSLAKLDVAFHRLALEHRDQEGLPATVLQAFRVFLRQQEDRHDRRLLDEVYSNKEFQEVQERLELCYRTFDRLQEAFQNH